MPSLLRSAAARVVRAITDEGPLPDYHRRVMARHRHEWPTLWAALDGLRQAVAMTRDEHDDPPTGDVEQERRYLKIVNPALYEQVRRHEMALMVTPEREAVLLDAMLAHRFSMRGDCTCGEGGFRDPRRAGQHVLHALLDSLREG